MVLRIGEADFSLVGAMAPDLLTIVFALTHQEFEGLSDGDPISFLYGPYETEPLLFFGRLQKSQVQDATLRLGPHFYMTKENATQRLSEIALSMHSSELKGSLQFTVNTLERSLESELWNDPARLDPITGEKVFNFDLEALKRLMELESSEQFPLGNQSMLMGIIHQLVLADRGLAAVALEDVSEELTPSEVQQINNLLLLGDIAVLEGDFFGAVEYYRSAWLLAMQA
jgi:hypothetical protein